MNRLENKIAIVTGAGQGIGRGISLAFAKEGATVVAASRTLASVEKVVAEIEGFGGRAKAIRCDVGFEDQVRAMVAETVAAFGAVDILVNNAQSFGTADAPTNYPIPCPLETSRNEEWEFTLRTGFFSTLWAMQAVFPHMKEKGGGKIINFGSMSGQRGERGLGPYNVTKEAIRTLTRTAAREWGRYQINVNVINPGAKTRALEESQRDHPPKTPPEKAVPLGRLGDPEKDIGAVALFLASHDGDYITGMTMMADGGLLMGP